ncbi:copper homeostasis protein CutC [Globicatella sanguinis]|uniref:copper homeostasis protein CutC n=1 Tax=Globicatella sanguinis TaxID=13076 RepID=UPI0025437FBC|nr:copper homeostasis protein CutC [Globicatella sanguinis]MDK7630900.1 copper homeostasis protein CutC [Globicatella sanguinis]WIK66163.1 copper homeostasis protein CutC [Globicatella sanguinis]WKT55568.1 copper homeostasis protein CutC [Globicatella sanguinis]
MLEICCGSYEDALAAYGGGARQIELNSALALGGLTPSLASLTLTKRHTDLKVICMVRPRGGGFCYSEKEFELMMADCKLLLEQGADGIAFGFLNEDLTLHTTRTQKMIRLIHQYGKEAVFHRAIDVVENYESTIELLVKLNIDRILTSGQQDKAPQAAEQLASVQERFGGQVAFIMGSGVNAGNANELMQTTGITNIHSSCKDWRIDPTTENHGVSYAYTDNPSPLAYDVVSMEKVRELVRVVTK